MMKPSLSGVKTGFPFPTEGNGTLRLVAASITAELMKEGQMRAKEMGATVNDLFLTACYRAYTRLPGSVSEGPVSVMSMMDIRKHCKNGESEGLCNMSGFLPTVLENGVQGDFTVTLREIALQTRKAKEDPLAGMSGMPLAHSAMYTIPLRLLLEVSEKVYGSLSIGLTNLGNISCEPLTLDGLRPTEGLFAGPLKKKPAMQVSTASFDGTAVLCCVSECEEDAVMPQKMLELMAEEVKGFAGV